MVIPGWRCCTAPARTRLRPGPVFEDPRFAEHVAFLTRMRDAGYLVAAGPMPDAAGDGMTILRLPGAGQLAAAARLATEDDASVAGGLLAVTVRPWQRMMRAEPWAEATSTRGMGVAVGVGVADGQPHGRRHLTLLYRWSHEVRLGRHRILGTDHSRARPVVDFGR